MPDDELRAELRRLREALVDLEETHSFDIMHTSAHIGSAEFKASQQRFEEETRTYLDRIAEVEAVLRSRGLKP